MSDEEEEGEEEDLAGIEFVDEDASSSEGNGDGSE